MWIDLALLAFLLLIVFSSHRRAAPVFIVAVLAYRHLLFPFDIAVGFILLQIAFAFARGERPRDSAAGSLMPEGERLFTIDKAKVAPSASPHDRS